MVLICTHTYTFVSGMNLVINTEQLLGYVKRNIIWECKRALSNNYIEDANGLQTDQVVLLFLHSLNGVEIIIFLCLFLSLHII